MNLDDKKYIPILRIRPSEMSALEQLHETLKDELLPFIPLRQWTTAHNLDAVETRIRKSFGNREIIVGLDYDVFELEKYSIKNTDIHQKLRELRDPHNYFEKWYNFIAERKNFVPSPILISDDDQTEQILRLAGLNRGVVIRINARMQNGYRPKHISAITNCPNIDNLLVIIDLGTIRANYLTLESSCAELINNLAKNFTSARFSICGSSFPNSFKGIPSQRIYEFDLFKRVDEQVINANRPLIYSDYASARATRIDGGRGQKIPPRIDIMQNNQWLFFRPDEGGYKKAASQAYQQLEKKSSWGAGLIESTINEETHKMITSQATASRARINIHLHEILTTNQAFTSGKTPASDDL